jgi:membrane dipeptidase
MKFFDLHCDTLTETNRKNAQLLNYGGHLNLQRLSVFNPCVQFFAVFVDDILRGKVAFDFFLNNAVFFDTQIKQNSEIIMKVKNAKDLETAEKTGKIGAVLTIEGSAGLGGKLENLHLAYECGVRLLTLTWNGECEAGEGVLSGSGNGLTAFGRELVVECERIGIIVDVSHLSDKSFEDVYKIASKPFIASHSNCRAVCAHPRNLTDAQINEIVRRGGIFGLNLCTKFLCAEPQKANCESIAQHIEHFLKLSGENCIALGCDYDGTDVPAELNKADKLIDLYHFLLKRGFSQKLVDKIFWGNAKAFFKRVLP